VTGKADRVEVQLEADWSAAADVEELIASQFLVQIGLPAGDRPDGVHLIVGHATPPILIGDDPASRQAQLARHDGKLAVRVHGRYFITRARLEELRNVLNGLAETYDELKRGAGGDT
jgi:hypothetical protein